MEDADKDECANHTNLPKDISNNADNTDHGSDEELHHEHQVAGAEQ